MQSIAVVGARGYVGSGLFTELVRSGNYSVTAVTRENYSDVQKGDFDIVINCAMPSARFWAKNNPEKDFTETVEKTARLLYEWKYKKFVQISTVSARCQLDTVYGRHKAAAEALCMKADNLIIRLAAMYDNDLKKGVLVDIKEGKTVFIDGSSRYCFTPRSFVAKWIADHLDRNGMVEVGARNSISLKEMREHLKTTTVFDGAIDHQEIVSPEADFPDARDVLTFLDKWAP